MSRPVGPTAAEEFAAELIEWLCEASGEVREAALFDRDGNLLAASGEAPWEQRAEALWAAVDRRPSGRADSVHVATEHGEVFAARGEHAAAIVTCARFALASLVFSDLRAMLRDLEPGTVS